MKKILTATGRLLLIILLLIAGLKLYAENEPNNIAPQANVLGVNQNQSGTMPADDPEDWWVITIPSDGQLYINTSSSVGLEIDLFLFDSNGATLIAGSDIGSGVTERTHRSDLKAGTYYVRAIRYSGTGSYTVTSTAIPTRLTNDAEPNNEKIEATFLPFEATRNAHLGYYGAGATDGVDWVKITLLADGEITVTTESDKTGCIVSYLYTSADQEITNSYGPPCTDTLRSFTVPNLSPGDYYIRSVNYSGYTPYTMIAKFKNAGKANDSEPNDLAENAVGVPLNNSITGHLGYHQNFTYDLDDWFSVMVNQDGKLTVSSTSEPTLCVIMYLYDANFTQIGDTYAGVCENLVRTMSHSNLMPGKYYIKANRYSGYGSYSISNNLQVAGLLNDVEPNNVADSSIVLPLNGSLTGHLGYYSRGGTDLTDWYKVTTNADGKLAYNTVSEASLCIHTYLYDQDFRQITDTYSGGCEITDRSSFVNNLQPGDYYLKVQVYGGYGSYTIKNTLAPDKTLNDTEPNETSEAAISLPLNDTLTGHLGYFYRGGYDIEDWYKVVTDTDGKLTINSIMDATLCVHMYLYDAELRQLADTYAGGCEILDRKTGLPYLEPGTYYIKASRYNGYGGYKIINSLTPTSLPNDVEPNTTVETANIIKLNDSITGHLGFLNKGITDVEDLYKVETNVDGKLIINSISDSTLCVHMYLYDEDFRQIADTYGGGCEIINRKTSVPNLQPGIYYIKASRYSGFGSYKITNTLVPANLPNDNQYNEVADSARVFQVNDSLPAHLGFFYRGGYDVEDWFKLETKVDGKLTFQTTSDPTLCVIMYVYDQDFRQIADTYAGVCEILNRTTNIPNLQAGIYYVKAIKYSGYGSYYIKNTLRPAWLPTDQEPNTTVETMIPLQINGSQTGHIGFYSRGSLDYEDWYKISVADKGTFEVTTSSDSTACLLTYIYNSDFAQLADNYWMSCADRIKKTSLKISTPGNYYIKIARYDGFGSYQIKDTLKPAPKANFTFMQSLNNFGFTDSSLYIPTAYSWDFGDGNKSTMVNPSHAYTQPGVYKVKLTVTNAAGTDVIEKNVEIEGVKQIVTNKAGNTGDATLTVYGGGFNTQTTFKLKREGYADITPQVVNLVAQGVLTATFNLRGKSAGTWDVVVEIPNKTPLILPQSFEIEAGKPADPWIEIVGRDRILFGRWQTYVINYGNNSNVDATGVPVWIAISANAEIEFTDIEIVLPTTALEKYAAVKDSVPIFFEVDSLFGQPFNGRVYPFYIPYIAANQSESVQIRVKSDANLELYAWINPTYYQSPMNPQLSECIRRAQMKALVSGIPGVDCLYAGMSVFYDPLAMPMPEPEKPKGWGSKLWDMTCSVAQAAWTCGSDLIPVGAAGKIAIKIVSIGIDSYGNYNAIKECEDAFKDQSKKEKKIHAVWSFDPNEITGPQGYGTQNYVQRQDRFPYTIFFENKNTATAPAQEVFVTDTLDSEVFDWSSFGFGPITFGDSVVTPLPDLKEFTKDVDLRPTRNCILRISASLDSINGVVKWQFVSLDPKTKALTEDPDAGFLPPNVTSPQGEGSVSFSVGIKKDLPNKSRIANDAQIVFDVNKPIETNVYVNHLDLKAPASRIHALGASVKDTLVDIEWSGEDMESGVRYYSIYVAVDDTSYEWLSKTANTTARFVGKAGKTYKFACIAQDSIGLTEPVKTVYDTQVLLDWSSIESLTQMLTNVELSPNPADNFTELRFTLQKHNFIEIAIYDLTGRIVQKSYQGQLPSGNHSITINTSNLSSGLYQCSIHVGHYKTTKMLMK